jgi:hypothetical protein
VDLLGEEDCLAAALSLVEVEDYQEEVDYPVAEVGCLVAVDYQEEVEAA